MNIWRSWFSLGNLNGLTAIMVADRSEKRIKVVAKDRFQAQETTGKLQEFYNVAFSLGDDVSASIAGSYLFDPTTESGKELAKLEMMAHAEGLELGFPAVLAHLHILARSFNKSPGEFVKFSRGVLEQTVLSNRRDHIESICQVVARTFEQSSRRQFGDIEHGPRFHHFLDPNLAVELAVRDPRSIRLLIGVFKRLHDHEWIFDFNRRLLDFFSHDSPPFGSSPFGAGVPELNSGDYAEWLLLFREIGGPGGLFQSVDMRTMSPKRFFGRMFDPRHLLELSERNPEGALIYLQILRELGGGRYLEEFAGLRIDPMAMHRMFDPRQLLELSERNPEGALTYLHVLRELGGGRFFEEFFARGMPPEEFFECFFHPRRLLELSDRNPEGALTFLQILRELGGGRFFEKFFARGMPPDEFFDRFFHPRLLLELSDRNPEGALAYLQILRELGGGRFFEEFFARGMPPDEFFDRFFHPRRLRELSKRNLDGALTYLQILRELGGRRFFEEFVGRRMTQDLIDFMFDVTRIKHFPGFRIEQFAVLLAIARLSNSDQAIRKLSQIMQSSFASSPHSINQLSSLPIAALPDLRWYAEQGDSEEIRSFVDKLSN